MVIFGLNLISMYVPLHHNASSSNSFFFWKNQGAPILKIEKVVGFIENFFLLFKIVWITDPSLSKNKKEKDLKRKKGWGEESLGYHPEKITPRNNNLCISFQTTSYANLSMQIHIYL